MQKFSDIVKCVLGVENMAEPLVQGYGNVIVKSTVFAQLYV